MTTILCPRCGLNYVSARAALSRRDNKTRICGVCGTAEAMEDVGRRPPYFGKPYWQEGDDAQTTAEGGADAG